MRKMTLWNDPIGHIRFWWMMKKASLHICGKWFGIVVYPNGRVYFRDDECWEVIKKCMKGIEE